MTVLASALLALIGGGRLGATPAAAQSGCASLGQAANFAVFTDGAFNAASGAGTTINGSIGAAGDVTLASVTINGNIVAGGNFTGGSSGGTVTGSVQYGGTANVAPNFAVTGGLTHAAPPFSFDSEFVSLKELSASLANLAQSPGATVSLMSNGLLQLTGTASGLNVFTVNAADLSQAQGVAITIPSGATALINVNTATILSIGLQYMNLSTNDPSGVLWNLPLATGINATRQFTWLGTILAPNAEVTGVSGVTLNGQLITASAPAANWGVNGTQYKFAGCLPGPPDTTLSLTPLCIDYSGSLDMVMRNTGDQTRQVSWKDLTGSDFGQFSIPPDSDAYFYVQGGGAGSVIQATSGTTTVQANGTGKHCQGQITVNLVTEGDAPMGQTWDVDLTNGDNGNVSDVLTLGSGDTQTVTVPGGYVAGTSAIDEVVGGAAYTISVDDPHGAVSTSISLTPVEILDGQNEYVTLTLVYESGTPGTGPPEPPTDPEQPTLPPGAPDPPPGPGVDNNNSGADVAITHHITPARLRVGGTIETVSRITNLGPEPAVDVVAREIPQYHPAQANSVAHVLSLTTTQGTCTQRRPVLCSLGTLAPGATVTIRTRTRVLVVAPLRSIVVVSSLTPDTNMTNNIAEANVTTFSNATVHAHISAPPVGRVATQLTYLVSAALTRNSRGGPVRLCTQPPKSFVQVRAPGTFKHRGVYCRDYPFLAPGHSVSFLVSAFPSATGRLTAQARATAVGSQRASRVSAHIVVASAVACPAAVRPEARPRRPTARAAC